MDESKFISNAFELLNGILQLVAHYGVGSLLGLFLIWEKWIKPKKEQKVIEKKKKEGTYVSWEIINERQKSFDLMLKQMDTKLMALIKEHSEHLKEEETEIGRFAVIESNQNHFKENINDLKEIMKEMKQNQTDAFKMIGDIKTLLIQRHQ